MPSRDTLDQFVHSPKAASDLLQLEQAPQEGVVIILKAQIQHPALMHGCDSNSGWTHAIDIVDFRH